MRKYLLFVALFAILPCLALAQGTTVSQSIVITNSLGRPLGGVKVEICTTASASSPACAAAASIYSDSGLTVPIACSSSACLTTDSLGQVPTFFALPGNYCYVVSGAYITDASCHLIVLYSATAGTAVVTNPSGSQTILGSFPLNIQGSLTSKNINGVRYTHEFSGADIGAQINAAKADCVSAGVTCHIVVDVGGTLSTSPVLGLGDKVELDGSQQYTFAVPFNLNHRSMVLDGHGAQISYALDNSGSVIFIGKNLLSVVNTSGSTVTWVSGSTFSTIDAGDQIMLNNAGTLQTYNVASATSTTITTTATIGTLSGVNMTAYLASETALGSLPGAGPLLQDVSLVYTGAGSTDNQAVTAELVTNPQLIGVKASLFQPSGSCVVFKGAITAYVQNLKCQVVHNGIKLLSSSKTGVLESGSNFNRFYAPDVIASVGASGNPLLIDNSSVTSIYSPHFEGNAATNTVVIQNGATEVSLFQPYFERNGDGTGSSSDVSQLSGTLWINDGHFDSSPSNHPATGVASSGAGVFTSMRNTTFYHSYTTSYNAINSATMAGENLTTVGAVGTLQRELTAAGNIYVNGQLASTGSTVTGAAAGEFVLGNAKCLRGASAANNSTACIAELNASNNVQIDPNGQGTSIGGGTVFAKIIRVTNVGPNSSFTAISAQTCQEQAQTVTGAATTGTVYSNPVSDLGNVNLSWSARVSATNTVQLRVCNPTSGSITPSSVIWNTTVIQ